MKNLNRFLYEYFYFTRRERDATFVLIIFCITLFFLPAVYSHFMPPKPKYDFSKYKAEIAAITKKEEKQPEDAQSITSFRSSTSLKKEIHLFHFDPNTVAKSDLEKLGLSARTAQTLLNYRSKGGRFFKKEDLKNVYGFRDEDYERLEEWIVIEHSELKRSDSKTKIVKSKTDSPDQAYFKVETTSKRVEERYEPAIIDINKASIEDWQLLSGIGPAYSKRIVNFREKLGGFATIELVGKTYGLPDSTFQKVLPFLELSPVYRKLAINTCSLEELKRHPLISNYQATIIYNFRQQNGKLSDIEDLKKIKAGFEITDWILLNEYFVYD